MYEGESSGVIYESGWVKCNIQVWDVKFNIRVLSLSVIYYEDCLINAISEAGFPNVIYVGESSNVINQRGLSKMIFEGGS